MLQMLLFGNSYSHIQKPTAHIQQSKNIIKLNFFSFASLIYLFPRCRCMCMRAWARTRAHIYFLITLFCCCFTLLFFSHSPQFKNNPVFLFRCPRNSKHACDCGSIFFCIEIPHSQCIWSVASAHWYGIPEKREQNRHNRNSIGSIHIKTHTKFGKYSN